VPATNQFWEFRKSIIFLLETINSPVFVIDNSLNIQYLNKDAKEVFQVSEDKCEFDDIFTTQGKETANRFLELESESTVLQLNISKPFSGIVAFSATKHYDPLTKSPLISLVCMDNTIFGRKTHKHQDFLQNMAENVAHNLRTPMTAVVGYANLLTRDLMNQSEIGPKLGILIEGIQRIDFIIRNLIDYSNNQQNLISDKYDIIKFCKILASDFKDQFSSDSIHFDINVNSKLNNINTVIDRHTIKTIINNMFHNSLEAKKENSLSVDMNIEYDTNNDLIKISIKDNGTGMSDEIISKCREPFFTTKINSLGLGLSIADNLLKAVGGDSQVSSKGKFGSEITIYLPQKINA
jgi:signal transduction histidine kinase